MKRPKLIFDIETVRQYENLSDAPQQHQDAWIYHAKSKFKDLTPAESYEKWAALYPEFSMIICISAVDNQSKEIKSMSLNETSEKGIIEWFYAWIDKIINPILIGHNIIEFDVPFINTRSVANGLPIHHNMKWFNLKPWDVTAVDTKKVWMNGQFRTCNSSSLSSVCLALGIESPKDDISGADVGGVFYKEGEEGVKRIVKYCEKDVKQNWTAYAKMVTLKMCDA